MVPLSERATKGGGTLWAPRQDRRGGLKETLFFPKILKVPAFPASKERASGRS